MRLIFLVAFLLLAFVSSPAPVFCDGCGLRPLKPLRPLGCRDLVAQCVTDGHGNSHWEWICVK